MHKDLEWLKYIISVYKISAAGIARVLCDHVDKDTVIETDGWRITIENLKKES